MFCATFGLLAKALLEITQAALATIQRPDVDHVVFAKAQDAVIVGDTSGSVELPLHLLVQLVGIRDFGQCPNCHLGAKRKLLPRGVVGKCLKGKKAKYFPCPCFPAQPISAFIGTLKSRQQSYLLLNRRKQLYFGNNFQYLNIITW